MVKLIPAFPGTGVFNISTACWTCNATNDCYIGGTDQIIGLGPDFIPGNITTIVGVPGGGSYRLAYDLQQPKGYQNSWRVIIEALPGQPPFPPIILDSFVNADIFPWTPRVNPFSLVDGTTSIKLVFQATHVSPKAP